MKSKLTIDFQGLDTGINGNQFEPVIRAIVEDSDDVRDGLMKAFFEGLKHKSNWLRADIWNHSDNSSSKQTITITPIKPEDFESTIDTIKSRMPAVKDFKEEEGILPSTFQIGDIADYTTNQWCDEAFNSAKRKVELSNKDISDEDIEYIPTYSEGKIVSVKFTEAKVYYNILDTYTGKIVEDIVSNNTKKFSIETKENLKNTTEVN